MHLLIETTALVNFRFQNGVTGNKLKDGGAVLSYSMTTQWMLLTFKIIVRKTRNSPLKHQEPPKILTGMNVSGTVEQ